MKKIITYFLLLVAISARAQDFEAYNNCSSIMLYDTASHRFYTYPKNQLSVTLISGQLKLLKQESPTLIAQWTAANIDLIAPNLAAGYSLISDWLSSGCVTVHFDTGGTVQFLALSGDTLSITNGNSVILPATGGGGYWDTTYINGNMILYSTMLSPLDPNDSTPRIMALDGIGVVETDTTIPLPAFSFKAKNGVSFYLNGDIGAEGFLVNSSLDTLSAIWLEGTTVSKTSGAVVIQGDNSSGPDIELNAIGGKLKLTNVPVQSPDYVLGYNVIDSIVTRSEPVPPALIKRVVVLDSAQIWNLGSISAMIVPAAAGKFHCIDKVFFSSSGGDDYDFTAGSVFVHINGFYADSLVMGAENLLNNGYALWEGQVMTANTYTDTKLYNSDFMLSATSFPTVGNKELIVTVYYYEF